MSLRVSACICALLLWLTGCGGGGGDGGRAEPPSFAVSFSPASLSITAVQGSAPNSGAALVHASGSGPTPESLYMGATRTGEGVLLPIEVSVNSGTSSATVRVLPNTTLASGTYTGALTLLACKDANCVSHHRGSPHTLPYTVTIVPRLAASPASATLSAIESTTGTASTLQLVAQNGAALTSEITYSQGQNWLSATVQGATVSLTPNATALLAGTYQAEVRLQTSNPTQTVSVPITLTVSPALQTPATIPVLVNGQTSPSALQGSFAVSVVTGAAVSSWTATSSDAWLVIDAASGAPNQPLSWHLDTALLASLNNFAEHTARITVSGGSSVTPAVTTVTASKQLPEIANLERLALLANEAGSVAVYGGGFNSLQNPAAALQMSGATPAAVSVLSDRVLTISLPALSEGSYPITLTNAIGIPTRSKPLTVLSPVTRSYQTIATQGDKRSLLWDAITQSAFVINTTLESVMRFDLSGANISPSARSIPGLLNVGLPLDRSALLVLDGQGNLHEWDPANLTTTRTRSLGGSPYPLSFDLPLAITGDNVLWVAMGSTWSGLLAYDLLESTPRTVLDPTASYTFYSGPWAAVSPNGQRLLMTQSSSISSNPPMLYWDAVDAQLRSFPASAPFQFFYDASTDRQGQRWLLDIMQVRGFDLGMYGEIDLPSGWVAVGRTMSRDGTRVYIYALHENAIGTYNEPNPIVYQPRIFAFDVSMPLTQTTSFPLIGEFDLPDYPACRATQGPEVCSPYGLSFTITDDDRTLLAVGDRRFIVIPIPASLRSH